MSSERTRVPGALAAFGGIPAAAVRNSSSATSGNANGSRATSGNGNLTGPRQVRVRGLPGIG
ncbi:MAG TPA: hypothetical protein VGL93_30720 [Streptosporangiaceae bacterium]|jgi:hypothetical protein